MVTFIYDFIWKKAKSILERDGAKYFKKWERWERSQSVATESI